MLVLSDGDRVPSETSLDQFTKGFAAHLRCSNQFVVSLFRPRPTNVFHPNGIDFQVREKF